MIDFIEALILSIRNKYLNTFSDKIFYKISTICLNSKTIAGLELFIRLNSLVEQVSEKYKNEIFRMLASISDKFESDLVFYEACKVFVVNLSRGNSRYLPIYITRLPLNIILKKDFAFLLRCFNENIINEVILEFIKNPEVSRRITEFYFENNIFNICESSLEHIIKNYAIRKFENPDLISKEDVEYFMNYFTNNIDNIERLGESNILKLISICIKRNLDMNILKAFENFIDKDDNIFKIAGSENGEYAQSFFRALNEMKGENKEDYQWLNLTSEFEFSKSNLEILEKILKPESINPAMKIICETPKNFVHVYDPFRADNLGYLIYFIIKRCHERRELLNLMTNNINDKFKFLVKTIFIAVVNSFQNGFYEKSHIRKELRKYLHEKLKLTPDQGKNIFDGYFDILDYFDTAFYRREDFDELRSILENIELNSLIDIYEERDWRN